MLSGLVSGAFAAGGAWAVIRFELAAMRHQINAAHRRLDRINAPPAGGDVLPG
jgi:hypothetical protein